MFTVTIRTHLRHISPLRRPEARMEKSVPPETGALEHNSLLMTEALAVAHNAPDTRQERIEALRAQIAQGEYEIDPEAIAEALVRENPGLFHK